MLGKFRHLYTDIYGNREFVEHLRIRGKFFDHEETFAIYAELDDLDRVTALVDELFTLLEKAGRI